MAITGISTAIIDIRAVDHISGQLSGMAAKIAMVGRAISSAGLAMTATFSIPLAYGIVKATGAAVEFDKSLRNIQAIGKQTDAEINALSQRMMGLSTDITKTIAPVTDLAEAFYEIQSSGRYGAEAEEILTKSTKAATAGLADTKDTALAVTKILNAYGMSAVNAGEMLDIMIRGVDIGIFRLQELNEQIGDFIGVAGLLKVPFSELTAALTTMTKKGLPIDEAATSLNRIFTTFLKPSDAATAAAKRFGIELGSEAFRAKGFAGAMQEVWQKTGGSADALAQIFRDIRGARGVFLLASDGMKMFNSDLEITKKAAGSVDQIFSVQIKSWSAQLQHFKNNAQAMGITIGTIVLPVLLRLLEAVNKQISAFQKLPREQQEFFLKLAAGIIALGPALLIIGQLVSAISILAGVLLNPIALVAALATAAAGILVLFAAWRTNTYGLADSMTDLSNQANIFGAALHGIINAFEKLDQAGFGQQDFLARATGIGGLGVTVDLIEAFQEVVKSVLSNMIELSHVTESFAALFKFIIDVAKLWGQTFVEIVNHIIVAVKELAGALHSTASALVNLAKGNYFAAAADALAAIEAYNQSGPKLIQNIAKSGNAFAKQFDEMRNSYLALQQEIKLQHEFEKQQLQLADVAGPLRTLMDYMQFIKANPRAALGGMDLILGTAADPALNPLLQLPTELSQAADDLAAAGIMAGDALGDASDKLSALAAKFADILSQAQQFSIALGDLRGGAGGGGPLAPGANGPFENLYRLQDIAMHWGAGQTPGVDTAKWVELLSKITKQAASPEYARETIKQFQLGNFTPDVMQFIDLDKIVAYARSLDRAQASQEQLVNQLVKQYGMTPQAATKAIGALAPTGTAAAGVAAQSIEVQTANKLLDAITAAITARTAAINTAGGNFMTALVAGMANEKQQFIDLFVSMIKDAAKLLAPPTPPTAAENKNGSSKAGAGAGGRVSGEAFALGGISHGGLALVGERGPELVNLPPGSRVYPNDSPINVTIYSQGDPRSIAHGTEIGLRRAARALGL